MQELASTFVSRSLVPTTSPRLRSRSRSVVCMTSVCLNKSDKEKVVVIMGATGTGKSRLSIDLATRFSGEIINSDKIQFYNGLEITTNQVSIPERRGIPHHLLGEFPTDADELTASQYRSLASQSIFEITSRSNLPIIAGGSNTFIYALLVNHFDPQTYPFSSEAFISSNLRYDCCFLWIDVSVPILFEYLSKRVDQMIESGMFEELASFYNPKRPETGIHKTIGVPEFDRFFSLYPPEKNVKVWEWEQERKVAYDEAVQKMKENTWRLAKKQIERIVKLKRSGWDIQRLDATASFEKSSRDVWDETVLDESVKIVKNFLVEN